MQGDFFLTQWAFLGMRWLYESLTNGSLVLTILISTIIIRGVSVFGDIKSRQSSAKMQAIQPDLERLRKKYAKDPQRLNVEQQKLMKSKNVSMFGGCLPMLITMPLFFVFIAAFRQWGFEMMVKLILTVEENPEAGVEMFKGFKFLWVNNMWQPDNGLKPVIQTAAEFLNNAKLPNLLFFRDNPAALQRFVDLGFFVKSGDLYSVATVTEDLIARYNQIVAPCVELYAGYNNGWFVLPVLAAGTTFLSSWIMMRGQPKNDAASGTNKVMQWMMPLMSLWVCLTYNSSFALYWTFSNIFSLFTGVLINRAMRKQGLMPAVQPKDAEAKR